MDIMAWYSHSLLETLCQANFSFIGNTLYFDRLDGDRSSFHHIMGTLPRCFINWLRFPSAMYWEAFELYDILAMHLRLYPHTDAKPVNI